METVPPFVFKIKCFGKNEIIFVRVVIITKQNSAVMVEMVLLGSTTPKLTLSASEIDHTNHESDFGSNFYHLLWCCCLSLATHMPHDLNTFDTCGEMISGRQDRILLKLALQPLGDKLATTRRAVSD